MGGRQSAAVDNVGFADIGFILDDDAEFPGSAEPGRTCHGHLQRILTRAVVPDMAEASDMKVAPDPGIASSEWPLWSTTARLVVTDPDALEEACAIADALLAEIDAACSRFRTDSELQRLSAQLPNGVEVSETLALLVRRALGAAAKSDGDVDPTLGYAMDAVGYDRDIRLVEDSDGLIKAVISPKRGWKSVVLTGRTLRVPASLALDLGATAKSVAADLVAQRISSDLGCGVLVSLGGDIATAGAAPHGGWNVLVQDAPGEPRSLIRLRRGHAVATSSTQKRRWRRGDEELHHILDPRTGRPAEPVWRTVTVAAPSCFEANTASTAAIVRGDRALPWLRELGVAARLVDRAGRVTVLGGWPSEGEEKAERGGLW
ncbi:MAG: FAD:protein transferase [Microbacteriaceae bacterium]|jgi:thiamine biosynthesis lipoprotein|nr:FAD:protein transferase [Microbacteriaceae bacterium]MDQ1587001.1 FAD:protein transferase [Microbacteriaceae bacterium]